MSDTIRVLITEDSELSWNLMKSILESDPQIKVVGWAKNGQECIEQVMVLKPDVITMDIHMPVMDGIEATKSIMENFPTSILVVSAMVKDDENMVFNLLKMGALDVIEKPKLQRGDIKDRVNDEVIKRVKTVAKVKPFRKFSSAPEKSPSNNVQGTKSTERISTRPNLVSQGALVIGASTGGPPVLNYILKNIPDDFPLPILITQHIFSGFINGLVEWLGKECHKKVKIGLNQEPLRSGTIYLAPDQFHMGVTLNKRIILSNGSPISGHRPSVDFLMDSAAYAYGEHCMGVLLTGMGRDGANGLLSIKKSGGFTVSQDEKSAAIFGMPKAAIDLGAAVKICSLELIPREIMNWAEQYKGDKSPKLRGSS